MTFKTIDLQGWLLTAALGIAMTLGTCAASALSSRQETAETRLLSIEQQASRDRERLATLEEQAKRNNADHEEIKSLLKQLVDLERRKGVN